jgi:ActR/RegA family two-component response regulator
MIPKREQRDWRELARQAAGEQDPKKLLEIIEELNAVLEEREKQLRVRFAKPTAPSISPQEASDKRLLFVDDEPNIRLTLPPLIEQYGFKVKSAGSVAEALGLIKSNKFDALLCDININQEGDGFTVVRAMREAAPDCVTVLLTGYPGFETALRAIHSEVDDYVVKPADIGILVSTLERKLSARRMGRRE